MTEAARIDDLTDEELDRWFADAVAARLPIVFQRGGRVFAVLNPPDYRIVWIDRPATIIPPVA